MPARDFGSTPGELGIWSPEQALEILSLTWAAKIYQVGAAVVYTERGDMQPCWVLYCMVVVVELVSTIRGG